MLKKLLFTLIVILTFNVNAQEAGKFRFGVELGPNIANQGGGIHFSLEPKINLAKEYNIGLSFFTSYLALRSFDIVGEQSFNAGISLSFFSGIAPVFNYYFQTPIMLKPFLGAGLGYAYIGGVNFLLNQEGIDLTSGLGIAYIGLIQGGFELSKFRFSFNYNILPNTLLVNVTNNDKYKIANSHFSAKIGFYIGGGKWNN